MELESNVTLWDLYEETLSGHWSHVRNHDRTCCSVDLAPSHKHDAVARFYSTLTHTYYILGCPPSNHPPIHRHDNSAFFLYDHHGVINKPIMHSANVSFETLVTSSVSSGIVSLKIKVSIVTSSASSCLKFIRNSTLYCAMRRRLAQL